MEGYLPLIVAILLFILVHKGFHAVMAAVSKMGDFPKNMIRAIKEHLVLGFALLKLGLTAIGILRRGYFGVFLGRYLPFVWVAAIIPYLWMVYVKFVACKKG